MTARGPRISIVVPAYRERHRLPALLQAIVDAAIAAPQPPAEIVVVDDGSPAADVTVERAAAQGAEHRLRDAGAPHAVRFLTQPRNRGKGAAIRAGWAASDPRASWLGFLDADGAVPAHELWALARAAAADPPVDVIAGTRMRMAGHRIERSLVRHLQGRVFATFVEELFHLGFYDTQCGAKLFRAERLRRVLPRLREDRWLLDVEVLALLVREGAVCIEEPVDWADPGGSKVIPGIDPLRMAIGLWRMRRRLEREAMRGAGP
jgi:glycosyltransferase involved in cell wall biosynthesis